MSIAEINTAAEEAVWDEYVHSHPKASGYHLMAWRQVVERTCGHRTFYLMATDDYRQVRGVLPLAFLSSRLFGRFLVSMPFFNYGGLLTDTREAQASLLEAAVDLAKQLRAAHIELRHQQVLDLHWPYKQHKVSMRLDLPDDFASLWRHLPSKLRSQVRRAHKEGMVVRLETHELLADFYQVFARNMRDIGTPVYGRDFFKSILDLFPKNTRICVIYLKGQPVAAALLYAFCNTLEIPWASADRRYSRLAPNMLLYSSALEYACGEGFRVFDFGRSSLGSGTYRFKEQWGARAVPLYWHYWVSGDGPLPELNPDNPRYSLAIKVWTRLPIPLTTIIGPAIVRSIP